MQIMITDLSLYAKTILEQHSSWTVHSVYRNSSWTVHSVYRKTINLQSGDLLLALQTAGSPLSPISLITDLSEAGMDAQKAVPGMEIPSSALQTDQANVRDLFLSPFSGSFGELSAAKRFPYHGGSKKKPDRLQAFPSKTRDKSRGCGSCTSDRTWHRPDPLRRRLPLRYAGRADPYK